MDKDERRWARDVEQGRKYFKRIAALELKLSIDEEYQKLVDAGICEPLPTNPRDKAKLINYAARTLLHIEERARAMGYASR